MKKGIKVILATLLCGVMIIGGLGITKTEAETETESKAERSVEINMKCIESFLKNQYDITVLVDGEAIGTVKPGKKETFKTTLTDGSHKLRVEKADDSTLASVTTMEVNENQKFSYRAKCKESTITVSTVSVEPLEDTSLKITFLDVGQGDSAFLECDGQTMLIDGGGAENSSLLYSFLRDKDVKKIDYMVATHSDEDHIGGLPGALQYAKVGKVFCPVKEDATERFADFLTYLKKQDVSITVPSAGDHFDFGGARVDIYGPKTVSKDSNNSSIVLKITYGKTTFLFAGDAEGEEESQLQNSGYDLKSDVLKVAHHGSRNSTSSTFLEAVSPKYAVISVGKDNSYGHPHAETLSSLKSKEVKVYRTDLQGDITCISDGTKITFEVEKNSDADVYAVPAAEAETTIAAPAAAGGSAVMDYVLNTNTRKFHYPTCSSVRSMAEHNKQYHTGTREEVINMGYEPCKRCHP